MAQSGLQPRLELNAAVTVSIRGAEHTGKIVKINADVGQYGVLIADLGQAYDPATGLGIYYLLPFEQVEQATSAKEKASPAPVKESQRRIKGALWDTR